VTGFLGDILSYTRILALVLATSVIAIVVNKLGFLLGPTPIGYIMFVVVGLLGHTLNLALSGLSAYVHASRLQYVEMFGKFFGGGGQFFKPLRRKTKYYSIRNEAEQERQQGAA
jgi:V/A-type H+-transporting ATPase subunit I